MCNLARRRSWVTREALSPAGKLKQECTIVVVSHDLRELSQQVRIDVLHLVLGRPHDVLHQLANPLSCIC
jgi:hypothetical protein